MNTVCVNKSKRFLQDVTKLKVLRGQLSGCSEEIKEIMLLLLSYFDEKEDVIFFCVEDICLAVQMDQVQLTPTIVVCVCGAIIALTSIAHHSWHQPWSFCRDVFFHQPRERYLSGEEQHIPSSCEPQSAYLDSRTFRP